MLSLRRLLLAVLLVAAAVPAAARGRAVEWQSRVAGAGLGNPLTVNPLNPRTLYGAAGTAGTLYVSRDGGDSWDSLGHVPGGPVKALCVSPRDTLTLLAGQERSGVPDRVVRSTDGGATWIETLSGEFAYFGVPVEFSPRHPDTVYTMTGTTVWRSVDFGATWEARGAGLSFNTWCDAAVRPDSADVLYVGDNTSGIWRSADGGLTFRLVHHTAGEIPMIAIDPVDPAVAYATKFNGAGSAVVKTTDGGESWTDLPAFSGSTVGWGIAVDQADHDRVVMGTYTGDAARAGIYVSGDGGASWERTACGLREPASYNYGLLAVDSATVVALQDDGIYALRRIDLDAYPRAFIAGALADSLSGAPLAGTVRLIQSGCVGARTIERAVDAAGAFRFDSLLADDGVLGVSYRLEIDPELPYAQLSVPSVRAPAGGDSALYRLPVADVFLVGEDSASHGAIIAGSLAAIGVRWSYWNAALRGAAPLERTTEFGRNTLIYFAAAKTSPLSASSDGALTSCLALGSHLLLAGQDLVERNPSAALFSNVLRVGFGGNASIVYNEGTPGGILDSLAFFTNGSGADYPQSRDVLVPLDSLTVPIAGYGAGGISGVAAVRRNVGAARAAYLGFGLETVNPAAKRSELLRRLLDHLSGATGVEPDTPGAGLPGAGRLLSRNYPNPFNPSTTIRFALPWRARVSLFVCDVLGRRVATLLDGEPLGAGDHAVQFNAAGLPSGVYAYRLSAASGRDERAGTGLMLLLK